MKTKSKILVLVSLLASIFISIAACNVTPQPPTPVTPPIHDKALRVTPAGTSVGKTNFILTNGKLPDVTARFSFVADKNVALVMDKPVIFATECDVSKIQYQGTWTLIDENGKDFETIAVINENITTQKLTTEIGLNYSLRFHITNIGSCERLSFKFNIFETDGYRPAVKPLLISDSNSPEKINNVQNRVGFHIQLQNDFTVAPDHLQILKFTDFPAPVTALCDPSVLQPSFYWISDWIEKDKNNKDVPKNSTQQIAVTDTFTADPTKTSYLRVIVANTKTCKTVNFAFAVAETSPTPTPAPSPVPVASPTP